MDCGAVVGVRNELDSRKVFVLGRSGWLCHPARQMHLGLPNVLGLAQMHLDALAALGVLVRTASAIYVLGEAFSTCACALRTWVSARGACASTSALVPSEPYVTVHYGPALELSQHGGAVHTGFRLRT